MEKGFMDYLKELIVVINWPVAVVIIVLLLRKQLLLFLSAIARKVDRPGEISLTKEGVTIKEYIEKKVEEKQNETLGILETGIGKSNQAAALVQREAAINFREGVPGNLEALPGIAMKNSGGEEALEREKDPLKYSWVGEPEDKNRKVSATVEPVPGTKLYKIRLTVESTSKSDPLKGKVWFHLHPTFSNPDPVVDVVNGKAVLNLISYGSFTVGVETDERTRTLKYNLAEVPGVNEDFKQA